MTLSLSLSLPSLINAKVRACVCIMPGGITWVLALYVGEMLDEVETMMVRVRFHQYCMAAIATTISITTTTTQ